MRLKSLLAICGAAVIVGCGGGADGPEIEMIESYHPDGTSKKSVVHYQGKKENIVRRSFYGPAGNMLSDQRFKGGKPDGPDITYFPDGNKRRWTNYKDSLRHGPDSSWFENGQLESEGNYVEGAPSGRFVSYFEDGTLASEVTFQDGRKHGVETLYFPSGKKRQSRTFNMGNQEGADTTWFENGNIESEHAWVGGIREGRFKTFYEKSGKIRQTGTYKGGQYFDTLTMFNEKTGRREALTVHEEGGKRIWGESFRR